MPLTVCEKKEVLKGIYCHPFSAIDLHSMLDSLLSWLAREILCDFKLFITVQYSFSCSFVATDTILTAIASFKGGILLKAIENKC